MPSQTAAASPARTATATTAASADPAPRPASGSSGFRADIEGLRAVAVLLVVVNHLTGFPGGGFVGVDVFFVISGFLITGLLVDESERRGRLSFRGFYARRVRRILPGALAVLLAVTVTAHLVFRGARVAQAASDVRWALGFAANIHFARIGVDYFQADRAPSLVQHFWSLAVEEQFYLVWPLVIVVVLSVLGRGLAASRARALLLAVVVPASAASFAYCVLQTRDNSAAAYFSSPGRAWELGAGAMLAVAAGPLHRLGTRLGPARAPLWLLGLAGVAVSAFVVPGPAKDAAVPSAPGVPGPWVALPVASAAVLLAAGVAGPVGRWGAVLTNPVSRYLGRISYSMYLWHWPVIVVAAALIPHQPGYKYPIVVLAVLGLSIASYHFIEAPFRRLGSGRRHGRDTTGYSRPAVAAAVCLASVVVLGALVPPRGAPVVPAARASGLLPLPTRGVAPAPPDLAAAIEDSLDSASFPELTPGLDQQGTARAHWGDCSVPTPGDVSGCTFGSTASGAKVAVVLGDSMAMSWLPGVEKALGGGWRIVGLTLESCPAANIPVYDTHGRHDDDCDAHHAWALHEAVALHPQLVVLSSAEDTLTRLSINASGAQAAAQYEAALRGTIAALGPSDTRRIVTLAPPPRAGSLTDCDTAGGIPADCVRPISDEWISLATAERAVADATRTSYVDTRLWFCDGAGFCPSFIGSMSVRWDTEHLTDVYARSLAAPLHRALLASD